MFTGQKRSQAGLEANSGYDGTSGVSAPKKSKKSRPKKETRLFGQVLSSNGQMMKIFEVVRSSYMTSFRFQDYCLTEQPEGNRLVPIGEGLLMSPYHFRTIVWESDYFETDASVKSQAVEFVVEKTAADGSIKVAKYNLRDKLKPIVGFTHLSPAEIEQMRQIRSTFELCANWAEHYENLAEFGNSLSEMIAILLKIDSMKTGAPPCVEVRRLAEFMDAYVVGMMALDKKILMPPPDILNNVMSEDLPAMIDIERSAAYQWARLLLDYQTKNGPQIEGIPIAPLKLTSAPLQLTFL